MAKVSEKILALTKADFEPYLRYDPALGVFFWVRIRSNRAKVGLQAGNIMPIGYWMISIKGHKIFAHRLAWLFVHGVWPKSQIDHINGNRADNRIVNLREATSSQNACNGKLRNTNKSGMRGVSWCETKRRWVASITINRKQRMLGRFKTKEEAQMAYLAAAHKLHGEFVRLEKE